MKNFILSMCFVLLASCASIAPTNITPDTPPFQPTPIIVEKPITDFPPVPPLTITKPPIIARQGINFVVSDEMVSNSILLKKFYDRINDWKKDHKIK